MLSPICAAIVGMVFLLTGVLKILAPSSFLQLLKRLRLLPPRWHYAGTALAAAGQCLLGWSLAFRLFPAVVFPFAMIVLAGLAALTLWARFARDSDDCGCYGGLFAMNPVHSVLLDLVYAALIYLGWPAHAGPASWDLLLLTGAVCLFVPSTAISLWAHAKWHGDLLELTPLREGRAFDTRWSTAWPDVSTDREWLVIFMSPHCQKCKEWIRVLNRIAQRPDLPAVVGLLSASAEEIEQLRAEHSVAFPLAPVRASQMDRLVFAFPVAAKVQAGKITWKGDGVLPPDVVDSLRTPPTGLRALGQAPKRTPT